jgi:3-deoxy-D-manno-octulosonic-acid transferase
LPRVYAVAHYAFLGGTLVHGDAGLGQNLVEPLVHGVPVFFGPHVRRWEQQTAALREVWPGLAISNAADLVEGVLELETSPATLSALRARAASLVEDGCDTADGHAAAARQLLGMPEPSV